jgi:hypothetical protein
VIAFGDIVTFLAFFSPLGIIVLAFLSFGDFELESF